MAQTVSIKSLMRVSAIALIIGVFAGCAEKDLYDPNRGKENLPPEESYFGYEMRTDVGLSVNYNAPGFQTIIEVYNENPMLNGIKKEGLKPIYSAYINDGRLESKMYVPTATKEAYLYTENWSLPECIKLELTNNGFVYDATKAAVTGRGALTRAFEGNGVPYKIVKSNGSNRDFDILYSLTKWNINGKPNDAGYLTTTSKVGNEMVAAISGRVLNAFDSVKDKSIFLRDAKVTNINIKEDNTTLDLTILAERGSYYNTFGYYYYKTGSAPAEKDLDKYAQKYLVFPDASIDNLVLSCGNTVNLLFFGEDGKGQPTKNFPKGYTIGWFFISNGYDKSNESIKDLAVLGDHFYSDNTGDKRRFVSLNDKVTGIVVLGFEDQKELDPTKEDYSDVLFFVSSNKKITEDERPEVPEDKPNPNPGSFTIEGTLAFEDIWPSGGDYDMNDVVVEYKRTFDYNTSNDVTKVTEIFKPVHDGADYYNFFAYQMKNKTTITLKPNVSYETATNSIIITSSVKNIQNEAFTIERTFDTTTSKDEAVKDFNPFIIVGKNEIVGRNRKEVHLPKHLATDFADKSLNYTEDDAYYVQKDGKYPFAIDIPVLNFKVATEKKRIDAEDQYPAFRTWADSKGTQETEWYLKK